MESFETLVKSAVEARRELSNASMGNPDPETIQSAKERLAHYTSEINDYLGKLEEQWLQKKGEVFMREVKSGASTDAASKRMSGECKNLEATVSKLQRFTKDAQNRITNAQSILKRWDNERNIG